MTGPVPKGRAIVGIDPGRMKCGYAVLYEDGRRAALEVVPTTQIAQRIEHDVHDRDVAAICVGDATTSGTIVRLCRERWPQVPLVLVDETNTTLLARRLYYEDHPPRGLLRFVPRGLLVPRADLDGYAAVLIAKRYLARPMPE